ncbi:hypothetical protein AQPE_1949 [Aquipluma nitroreducens]|uniref:Uncharacterized protein n=1 Tax=Aquipluma nitroreducens TaxID=2010828 RepID=A0A5K7S8B4_9BACT|nr:hypothetical protein AQPE_1949 [Aquipluma nitroreducens]
MSIYNEQSVLAWNKIKFRNFNNLKQLQKNEKDSFLIFIKHLYAPNLRAVETCRR